MEEKETIEKVTTGIKGLDLLLNGGIPKFSSILLSGMPGTGKTILSLEFLVNGALKNDETGIYLSLEEEVDRVKQYMQSTFNWPIKELEKKKKLIMIKSDIYEFEKFKSLIETNVEKSGAQRIVIDPLTVISLFFERPLDIRRSLLDLDKLLKRLKCTSLLTCEIPEGSVAISSFGIEEFTCDGIIILSYSRGLPRGIHIRKMRATNHDMEIHPFEIREKEGIVVYPTEKLFPWEAK